MTEPKIRNLKENKVNEESERDFVKVYEDISDESEVI